MAGDTYGRLFTVTTFGESHGPAMGCVVDGCPPGSRADGSRHSEGSRSAASRPLAPRHAAPRAGSSEDPLGRVRRPHDGHGDRLARRERRPEERRLLEDQGQLSARPRRLHVSAEVRHSRLSRRRPLVRARDRHARRRRRDRAQVSRGAARRRDSRLSRRDRPVQAARRSISSTSTTIRSSAPTRTRCRSSRCSSTSCAGPATRSARASI